MKSFFECNISFREDGEDKDTKQVLLIDALSFTESEASIAKYFKDLNALNVISMNRVIFDDLVYAEGIEEYSWYEYKVKMRLDSGKDMSFRGLVADDSVKKATDQLIKYLEDSDGLTEITSIKQKQINDVILSKSDENFPEEEPVILSFDEHKDLTIRLEDLKELNSKLKESLGAESISFNKYKVRACIENKDFIIGKTLGKNINNTWTEDFVDEDTGDVVSIERHDPLVYSGTTIGKDDFQELLNSKEEFVVLKR